MKTPQDLALKAVAERQYLVFNLLARGKLAWDAGDFATAAARWEALLRIPGIDPELDKVVRPLAAEARSRAGGAAGAAARSQVDGAGGGRARAGGRRRQAGGPHGRRSAARSRGGGNLGPGGAVVWLKKADGATPAPVPGARARPSAS